MTYIYKCNAENGAELPSSSDEEDKNDTEVAPTTGPVTHPCGKIRLLAVNFYLLLIFTDSVLQ